MSFIEDDPATTIADLVIGVGSPDIEAVDGIADMVACNTVDLRDALHRLKHEPDCYQQTVMHLGYDAKTPV